MIPTPTKSSAHPKNFRTGSPVVVQPGNLLVARPVVEPMPTESVPPPSLDAKSDWDSCERGDWLMGWAETHGASPKLLVRARCALVRLILSPEDVRAVEAVRVAEAWSRGEATTEEVTHATAWANISFLEQAGAVSAAMGYTTGYYASYAAATTAESVYVTEEPGFSVADAVVAGAVLQGVPTGLITFERIMRSKSPRERARAQCADVVRGIISWDVLTDTED